MLQHYHGKLAVRCPEPLQSLLESSGRSLASIAQYLEKEASSVAPAAAAAASALAVEAEGEVSLWATTLALYGWTPSKQCGVRREAVTAKGWSLTCGMCGRSLHGWNIVQQGLQQREKVSSTSTGGGGRGENGDGPPCKVRRVEDAVTMFDPVGEHRWYCSWVSKGVMATAKRGQGEGVEGWRYCTRQMADMVGTASGSTEVSGREDPEVLCKQALRILNQHS